MSEGYPISQEAREIMLDALPTSGEVIEDPSELAYTMGKVALAAPGVGLPHIPFGFYAYEHVTRKVAHEASLGNFDDPDKMIYTMPRFAKRIFDAVELHTNGASRKQIGPWANMFYSPAARKAPPSTSMVDFLGFHVLYDLPFTLYETRTEPKHKDDYTKQINLILKRVSEDISHRYVTFPPLLERARASEIGVNLVMRHLYYSRDHAWRSFEKIQEHEGRLNPGESADYSTPFMRSTDRRLGRIATVAMLSPIWPVTRFVQTVGRTPTEYWQHPDISIAPPSLQSPTDIISDHIESLPIIPMDTTDEHTNEPPYPAFGG